MTIVYNHHVRELGEKAKGAFATIQKDNERIQQLGGVLEERKEQSLRQVGGDLWSLAQNFERTQKKSDGSIVIDCQRFELPNRYRHLARVEVRFNGRATDSRGVPPLTARR